MGKTMSQREIVQLAAQAGAKAALTKFEETKRQFEASQHDRRLRNVRLLLQNFQELDAHSQSGIYDASQVEAEDFYSIIDAFANSGLSSELYIESIKKSVGRTRIIIEHVRLMLEFYRLYCERSARVEEKRRYRVVKRMFLDEEKMTAQDVAELECVDVSTVYKDVNAACEKLTALIFGVDGIKKISDETAAPKIRH